jgi:hypothetical protein
VFWKGNDYPKATIGTGRIQGVLGYEAGHLLRRQRTLETKEVIRRGLFSSYLESEHPPDTAGFNKDPECKV